jgi:hypothetical protein
LPEPATEVHVIATDDPIGIERYWRTRFSDRRKNAEWVRAQQGRRGGVQEAPLHVARR